MVGAERVPRGGVPLELHGAGGVHWGAVRVRPRLRWGGLQPGAPAQRGEMLVLFFFLFFYFFSR